MVAAVDDFATFQSNLDSPYANAVAVATSDTFDLSDVTRAIYVGGTGDVTCTIGGSDVLFKAVPVGTLLRIRTSRVKASGTTATQMVALW